MELPAGGNFTVELAGNRAFTTFSYGGKKATEWPDGKIGSRREIVDSSNKTPTGGQHPENYSITNLDGAAISSSGCLSSPNCMTPVSTLLSNNAD